MEEIVKELHTQPRERGFAGCRKHPATFLRRLLVFKREK